MDPFKRQIQGIQIGTGFLLIYLFALFLSRLVFFLNTHPDHLEVFSIKTLFAFLYGIRFDLSALLLIGFPAFLLLMAPFSLIQKHRYRFLSVGYLSILLTLSVFLEVSDSIYFNLSGKRLTFELYLPGKDLLGTLSIETIISFSIYIAIASGVVALSLILFFAVVLPGSRKQIVFQIARPSSRGMQIFLSGFLFFLLLPLSIILVRGGVQLKALDIGDAFFDQERYYGYVAMNTMFNITHGADISSAKINIHTLISEERCKRLQEQIRNPFDHFPDCNRPFYRRSNFPANHSNSQKNIILIVMESFNAEEIKSLHPDIDYKGLAPHFSSWSEKGLLFTRYYSTAKRSVEAFPAILNSLPDFTERPIIGSAFETVSTEGVAAVLKHSGYRTLFFHGAKNGSMELNRYASLSGFDQYYGLDEYIADTNQWENYDGTWGVYDHIYFDYFYNILKTQKAPYFATFFALSNHLPCNIPRSFEDQYRKKPLSKCEKAFLYSDESLGMFLTRVSKDPDFQNTIFLITSDHYTFFPNRPRRPGTNLFSMYHVPLLLYAPGTIKPGKSSIPGDHTDLLPTIIDLLKLKTGYSATGQSLLRRNQNHFVFIEDSGYHIYMKGDYAVTGNFRNTNSELFYKSGLWINPDLNPEALTVQEKTRLHKKSSHLRFELQTLYSYLYKSVSEDQFSSSLNIN